jgi:hypothetical protein
MSQVGLKVKDCFTGALLQRDDPGYDHARFDRVWNLRRPDRYPAAVLVAETESDVLEGVRLARERGWQVGVRAGGHSFPAWGLRDDAILIDVGRLNAMEYDEATGIVAAGPAVQGGNDLMPYLKRYGRFFPTGGCGSVGLGGFLLQGGMGWNHRGWGWSAEQIVAIDVVTADGELVRADSEQNTDLFWAARGAGPGFVGIVTRFHLQTRPIPAGLAATLQIYPLDSYAKVLEWLCSVQRDVSASVHLVAICANPPTPIPGHEGLVFAIQAVAFGDSFDESAAALAPLMKCPFIGEALVVPEVQPTTIEDQHAFVDAAHPPAMRYMVDSAWVEGDYAKIIAATETLVMDRPRREVGHTFFWFTLPHDAPDMAAGLQTELMVGSYIIYPNESDDTTYRNWSSAAMKPLEPFTVGQYWGDSDQQHRHVKCVSDSAWRRLEEIRANRDPSDLFVGYLTGPDGFDNANGWRA